MRGTFAERFACKIDKAGPVHPTLGTACWMWKGAVHKKGYGQFCRNAPDRRSVTAHRASWEIHFGPIPDGLFVCHHCDNPVCVRPEHLFLGTVLDNTRDRVRKGRSGRSPGDRNGSRLHPERLPHGERCHLSRLTAMQVETIRTSGSVRAAEFATAFGVNVATVQRVRSGATWKPAQAVDLVDRLTTSAAGGLGR